MNDIANKNPSTPTLSGNKDHCLTFLEELKLKFELRSKLKSEISCTSQQLERSVGSIYIDCNQKLADGPLMSENLISNTTTDISEIDNDQLDELIPEIEINDPFREDIGDDVSKNKESPRVLLNVDNVWEIGESLLVQGRPALKSLWEELMKERNEHHKTAYTLESLQKMYYTELQKNATLQNTIDKLRFSGGSSPIVKLEPAVIQFQRPLEKDANVIGKHYEDKEVSSVSLSTNSSQRKLKFKRITESSESLIDFTNLVKPNSTNLEFTKYFDVSPSKEKMDCLKSSEESKSFNRISPQNDDNPSTEKKIIVSVDETDDAKHFGLIQNPKLDKLRLLNPNMGSVNSHSLSNGEEQPVQEIKRKITQKRRLVANSGMEDMFYNLPNATKTGGTESNIKQTNILRLYESLELADQQSSLLYRRSREMLLNFTRLNIKDNA